jgi:putative spermidine/putrescine transport system ATP-binding protein
VSVAIRPEAVRIGADAADMPNRQRGVLRQKSFLGSVTRAGVEIAGGAEPQTLLADFPGTLMVSPGDALEIGWRTEDALVLARDPRLEAEDALP